MRLDKSMQELEVFDKTHLKSLISQNISILVKPLQVYPNGNLANTAEFGYVALLPHPKQNITAFPCTMASTYDKERKMHCPEYMYHYETKRILRRAPKI